MKYVSLSTDAHRNYAIYAPLVCRIWRRLGWEPILAVHPDHWDSPLGELIQAELDCLNVKRYPAPTYPPFGIGNTMRVVRLAGPTLAEIKDDDILLTADVDVCPLSREFFAVDDTPDNATWDIFALRADFQGFLQERLKPVSFRFAMCYVGMRARIWRDILSLTDVAAEDTKATIDRIQTYTPEQTRVVLEHGGVIERHFVDSTDMDELWMTAHILSSTKYVDGPCALVPDVTWCGYPVHQQGRMRLVPTRLVGGMPDRMMLLGEWRIYQRDHWDLKTAIDWHMPRPPTNWMADVLTRFWPEEAEWINAYWSKVTLLGKLTDS